MQSLARRAWEYAGLLQVSVQWKCVGKALSPVGAVGHQEALRASHSLLQNWKLMK